MSLPAVALSDHLTSAGLASWFVEASLRAGGALPLRTVELLPATLSDISPVQYAPNLPHKIACNAYRRGDCGGN